MPQERPITQVLSPFGEGAIEEVRCQFCDRVSEQGQNEDLLSFETRVRNSLKTKIDSGKISIEDVVRVLKEYKRRGPKRPADHIRETLKELTLSKHVGLKRNEEAELREHWIASEVFQALRVALKNRSYGIDQEKRYGDYRPDIIIAHEMGEKRYVVEIKRAGQTQSLQRAAGQCQRYRRAVDNHRITYLLLVIEDETDHPDNNDSVKEYIEDAEGDYTTPICVEPDQLRYQSW